MTKLQRLYAEQGQSPWLDNLTRALPARRHPGPHGRRGHPRRHREPDDLRQGHRGLGRLRRTVRLADRRRQFRVDDAYWELVIADVTAALAVLRPVFDAAAGTDGFVSVEVAPELARDIHATIAAARALHERIDAAEPVRQDPGDGRGRPRDRGDDRRGPQHQRHPDLLPRPLRRGHRGLPARPRDVRRRRRRPLDGPQRRLVLRQPGRHRGRPAAGSHRHRRGAGVARPSRGRPGQARLRAVPASSSPARGGSASPISARTCSGRCGPRRPPRTRPTPTPSTSTSSSAPTPSTPCPNQPSPPSRTTAAGPHPRHRTVDEARRRDAPAGRRRHRHGRRRPDPRRQRRRQLPPVLPRRACRACDVKARQLSSR